MTARSIYKNQGGDSNPEQVLFTGSFCPNGTGTPTLVSGTQYSVVRASEGNFTVTLTDMWPQLMSHWVSVTGPTGTAHGCLAQWENLNFDESAKTGTIGLTAVSGTGAAYYTDRASTYRINFGLVFLNTNRAR